MIMHTKLDYNRNRRFSLAIRVWLSHSFVSIFSGFNLLMSSRAGFPFKNQKIRRGECVTGAGVTF